MQHRKVVNMLGNKRGGEHVKAKRSAQDHRGRHALEYEPERERPHNTHAMLFMINSIRKHALRVEEGMGGQPTKTGKTAPHKTRPVGVSETSQ